MDYLFLFFIEEFQERSYDTICIKFDDVSSEQMARNLSGLTVLCKKNFLDPSLSSPDIQNFIGFSVKDNHSNFIGILDAVLAIENNPLMRILKNKKEILLPLREQFLVSFDMAKKEITVELPEGLLDLYL